MRIGAHVKVLCDLYGLKTRGRLAVIVDIDRLSDTGSYPDRYSVRMKKSGAEFDTVADCLALHYYCQYCEGSGIDECNTGVPGVRCRMCGGTGKVGA